MTMLEAGFVPLKIIKEGLYYKGKSSMAVVVDVKYTNKMNTEVLELF